MHDYDNRVCVRGCTCNLFHYFAEFLPPPLLVGSVGPYGAALHDGSEYTGCYAKSKTEEELANWHRSRIQALDEAGVRLLAVETIPALSEAKAVLRLLRTEFPHLRAWVSFSCKVLKPHSTILISCDAHCVLTVAG